LAYRDVAAQKLRYTVAYVSRAIDVDGLATCVRQSICSAVVVQQNGSFGVRRGSPRTL
jgi:hypothetical protein